MKTQLFVPKKIKVGFNLREDTYTGKLGYVIAHDGKTWRKEKSWESWRQEEGQEVYLGYIDGKAKYGKAKGVEPVEYDNVPTEGFVLNKKVGGHKSDWNMRQTYSRVYDPRGFEFEITVPNLLFILQETNSIKGKGLEGDFVYAWDGKDLVLLPAGCPDYQECVIFTNLQSEKISTKELIPGAIYETKKQQKLIYIGKYNCYGNIALNYAYDFKPSFDYVFADDKGNISNMTSLGNIAKILDANPVSNYADLVEKALASDFCSKIKSLEETVVNIEFYENKKTDRYWGSSYNDLEGEDYKGYRYKKSLIQKMEPTLYKKISDGVYQIFHISRVIEEVDKKNVVAFKDGTLEQAKKHYKETYFCWKHKGYQLTSTKTVVFENEEIKIKDTKYKNDTILQKSDIEAMNFVGLEAKVKSGKKYKF